MNTYSLMPNVQGLECENAFDNDPNTHWYPASSWQMESSSWNQEGKLPYADHETGEFKRGEQPVYTMVFDQYIGLNQVILQQFNFGHGFASKVRYRHIITFSCTYPFIIMLKKICAVLV